MSLVSLLNVTSTSKTRQYEHFQRNQFERNQFERNQFEKLNFGMVKSLAPLVSNFEDMYMQNSNRLDAGQAAKAHAARKSAFLSMSRACNFEAFSRHFHLPLKVAAEKFGVRATAFKKRCRTIGIRHWPYRKVRSLKRSLQELHRCKKQTPPLSDKQQAQFITFKRQLDKLMAPETYGLDPSRRLGSHQQQQLLLTSDDNNEHAELEKDGYNSIVLQSPRLGDTLVYDCTVSLSDAKTLSDVIPAGSTHLWAHTSQVMQSPPIHLSFFENSFKHAPNEAYFAREQYYQHFDGITIPSAAALVIKTSSTSLHKQTEDCPSIGFESVDLDFLLSETNTRSLNDADDAFTAHASQIDYSSERFFDDVFLQILPDYGCLV